MKNKYIVLLIVVILIVVGGIYYFLSNTNKKFVDNSVKIQVATTTTTNTSSTQTSASKSTTANWKTYMNSQYGFEFQYPADWNLPLEKNPHDGLGSIELGCPKEDVPDTEACPLNIGIWQSGSYEISIFDSPKAETKTFTVNGVQIKEFKPYKEPGSDGPIGYDEIANIPGDNITVQFTDSTGDYESNGIFDQILSTFKFTK
jgi:uncharacterized protein YxeA